MPKLMKHPSFPGLEFDFIIDATPADDPGWEEARKGIEEMNWLLIGDATPEHLGFIPGFIKADDPRPIADQINERYVYGGWRPQHGFTMVPWQQVREQGMKGFAQIMYPGDPAMNPIALTFHAGDRPEIFMVYRYGYCCILQNDDSFEVARLD